MIKARKAVLSYSVKDKQNIESLGEKLPVCDIFCNKETLTISRNFQRH